MLYHLFLPIRKNAFIRQVNRFFYSPFYMLLVAGLMAISNICAAEFTVFYFYAGFCVYTALFAPDLFPIAPMFCCGYMLFSANNNPAANYGEHFLSSKENQKEFLILLGIAIVMLITRLVYELVAKKRYRAGFPKLTIGFALLGVAYVLGGLLSNTYSQRTAFFGFVQIASLCLTYYFFYYGVDWSKRRGSDIAYMFCAIGLGLVAEVVGMYATPQVIEAIYNGTFRRSMLISGWGVYNNVGGMVAMMIPAPFYLATTRRLGPIFILPASMFMMAVILTQSRGAILTGALIFVLCLLTTWVFSKGITRMWNIVACLGMGLLTATIIAELWEPILSKIFTGFDRNNMFDSSARLEIYRYGLEQFRAFPYFGNGFYIGEGIVYQHGEQVLPSGGFLPPRFHNTFVQLLASGGVVALIAYLVHRVQTIYIMFRRKSLFGWFFGLAVAALLLASLVDCHFFNFGPGLTYGVMLVSIERIGQSKAHKG